MTECICKSARQKNKLYDTYLGRPNKATEDKYKRCKNKLSHISQITKKKCYENQFIKYKNDSKMTWKTINKIVNNKSWNELPNIFYKNNSNEMIKEPTQIANKGKGKELSKSLTHTFNTTFITGITADQLKIALISPIFKTGDQHRFENYRPIYVLT